MFELIEHTDRELFLFLNGAHSPFFDRVMPHLTEFWIWIPLFAWGLYEVIRTYRKKAITVLLLVVVLVVFTDQSANAVKKTVRRYRPSHNLELAERVHTVNDYKGGAFGFVSNHAANVFGIAFFLFFLFRPSKKVLTTVFFCWAIFVGYSRIYLGVHYPLDILGGAIIGLIISFLIARLCKKTIA